MKKNNKNHRRVKYAAAILIGIAAAIAVSIMFITIEQTREELARPTLGTIF